MPDKPRDKSLQSGSGPRSASRPAVHRVEAGSLAGPGRRGTAGRPDAAPPSRAAASPADARRGIQSIEIGSRLLQALVAARKPLKLSVLAAAAEMPPAKAHGYLVSLQKVGLIEQDGSGAYALGPFALQLGLASLQSLDPLRAAEPIVRALVDDIGHAVAIAVWGTHGPTVVRLVEAPIALHINLRVGTVMSLTQTATGRVFAAWLPAARTAPMLAADQPLALGGDAAAPSRRRFEQQLAEVRAHGLAQALGAPLPGINAISAPVFDAQGGIALVLTAVGPAGAFDAALDGEIARAVKTAAAQVSRRIGFAG